VLTEQNYFSVKSLDGGIKEAWKIPKSAEPSLHISILARRFIIIIITSVLSELPKSEEEEKEEKRLGEEEVLSNNVPKFLFLSMPKFSLHLI
jgi:hypothetical protein